MTDLYQPILHGFEGNLVKRQGGIFMKTLRQEKVGAATLRIAEKNGELLGVVIRDGKPGEPVSGEDEAML